MMPNYHKPQRGGAGQDLHSFIFQNNVPEPTLWNSQMGRRQFLGKVGKASVGAVVVMNAMKLSVLASDSILGIEIRNLVVVSAPVQTFPTLGNVEVKILTFWARASSNVQATAHLNLTGFLGEEPFGLLGPIGTRTGPNFAITTKWQRYTISLNPILEGDLSPGSPAMNLDGWQVGLYLTGGGATSNELNEKRGVQNQVILESSIFSPKYTPATAVTFLPTIGASATIRNNKSSSVTGEFRAKYTYLGEEIFTYHSGSVTIPPNNTLQQAVSYAGNNPLLMRDGVMVGLTCDVEYFWVPSGDDPITIGSDLEEWERYFDNPNNF